MTDTNGLSLNTEKTKFMIIKSKFNNISNTNHNEIFINDQGLIITNT